MPSQCPRTANRRRRGCSPQQPEPPRHDAAAPVGADHEPRRRPRAGSPAISATTPGDAARVEAQLA